MQFKSLKHFPVKLLELNNSHLVFAPKTEWSYNAKCSAKTQAACSTDRGKRRSQRRRDWCDRGTERARERCDRETERVPKGSKMERQTVTEGDKTKTVGSVSETKEDKSPLDSCWRLHRDIGETSCHWQMYVRVLLMPPCFPFVVTEMS